MAARVPPSTRLRKRTQLRTQTTRKGVGTRWGVVATPVPVQTFCTPSRRPGPGRTRRRLGVRPALPLALTCRTDWCPAGLLARHAEDHGPLLIVGSSQASGSAETSVPLTGSRLARGPLAGPHDGQFRAGGEPPVRHHRLRGPAPAQVRNRPAPTRG
jgi:hypothetical protein